MVLSARSPTTKGPSPRPYFFRYISDRGVANLPSYKYSGSDSSLLYQHFVSPWCNAIIEKGYVPRWIHPNVITLSGLMWMIAAHLITIYYCPTFSEDAPGWIFSFAAVAQLIYWILDALDGKQARKTKTSSPLGLLMDHGCDAMNTSLAILNCCAMAKTGSTMKTFVAWAAGALTFFGATWEEYFVGSLDLPPFNGPNEGIVISASLYFFTAFIGNSYWEGETYWGLQRNTVLVIIFLLVAIGTVSHNIIKVMQTVKNMQAGEGHFTPGQIEAGTRIVALTRFVPILAMIGMAAAWAFISPTDVLSRHPRVYLWTLGLLLCKLVMTMMLAHLSDEPYHPFGKTLAGFLALGVHGIVVYVMVGVNESWEDLVLYELAGAMLVSYVHMVTSMAWEISTLLKITVFTVPPEKREGSMENKKES